MNPIKANNLLKPKLMGVFFLLWALLLWSSSHDITILLDYALFSFLGTLGAIFANSTGAGGGVVFIPMFAQLNFTEQQSIATSFAIQCFGMTAGAVTWWYHYKTEKFDQKLWPGFKRTIGVVSFSSILALGSVFYWQIQSPASLHTSFSWFSLLLGLFIMVTVYLIKDQRNTSKIERFDYLALLIIGGLGGTLTAWLSVGVGELLVIYLIIRRFDIEMAVAAAVVVSALSVWSAVGHIHQQVYWQVLLFAGPGAVLGGVFAKTLVTYLSATRLKLFFSCWLLLSGSLGVFS